MKNKERERQPRYKNRESGAKKTPLTFYRSAAPTNESKSPFKRKELHPSVGKLRNFLAAFLDGVILIALLLLIAYSLIIRPDSRVQLNSELFHSTSEYQAAANKILKGAKNSNKVTFSEQSLSSQMEKQFPEITSVHIELPVIAQTPVIHLKIASPSFVISSKGNSYIVDSDGVAVANAANFPKAQELLKVDDQSEFTDQLGKQVMSAGSVQFINTLAAQSKRADVPISSLTLPAAAQELDLRTSDRPYYVKFFLSGDPQLQSGQYLASRHQFDSTSSQPAEYLDVRVSGKIFYK
jgi:cell division septal protein FtsQ